MVEREKIILVLAMENRNLIPLLFSNCEKELFSGQKNRQIFQTMIDLYKRKSDSSFLTVGEMLEGKIGSEYFTSMIEAVKTIPITARESTFLESIKVLKENKGRRELLKELSIQANSAVVDFKEIQAILDRAKVIGRTREKADFRDAYGKYLKWIERGETNITLGFPSLDKKTDSFNFGELISILGRPTSGKTFMGLNILKHLEKTVEYRKGLFSHEMPQAAAVERIMQLYFNLSRQEVKEKIKDGTLSTSEFLAEYEDIKVYERVYSVSEIGSIIEEDEIKIAIIDYLDLIKAEAEGTLYQEVTKKILGLKELAKNQLVLIILLVQLSRTVEDWEPVKRSSARDSGHIEQVSDFMFGLWNSSAKKDADPKWTGKRRIELIKNKRGPAGGIVSTFDERTGRMIEIRGRF